MTTHHHDPIECECGHKGFVHWKENDAPFTKQYESYSLEGFEGRGFSIDGFVTSTEALERLDPKCPKCGKTGKVKYAKRT